MSQATSGIATQEFNAEYSPQSDLFRYVNGSWLETQKIPADRASAGSFLDLADAAELAVREIIESAAQQASNESDQGAGSEAQKIGALYASFMDEAQAAELGASPLAEPLTAVYQTATNDDVVTLNGELQRGETSGLLAFYVANDPGDPQRNILQMYQSGLGLPDESYYREEQFAEIREKYQEHIAAMFRLAQDHLPESTDPLAAAQRVFDLETRLAAGHMDRVSLRDPQKTYNLRSWEQAQELLPQLRLWFRGLDAPDAATRELVIATEEYFRTLAQLLRERPVVEWQDWLAFRVISSAAPYLSDKFVQQNFDFYGKTLSGTEQIRDRWKRGVALVEGALGEAVGKLYVAQHFPPEHKLRMEQLVQRLIQAYRESMTGLSWMSNDTKERALEKLDKFTPKIGYPSRWRDYEGLEVDAKDLLGNVRRANAFELHRELAKIGQPIDREEWLMTPQTVNAYYHPLMNEIVFPAAILQPPFFDADAEDAANYGGIGAVIGHEIGHGFDDQGSQYDGDGALKNWWTDADREAFEERTAALVAQYNALAPIAAPEQRVNGEFTLGENIGDLGGLSIAYKAWLLSLGGDNAPELDGLTGAQRFFLSWAQCWRSKNRPEEAARRITVDPHSPAEWRCNQVVKNIPAFYQAFAVTQGDDMWLAEDQRVSIW